ncbi:MAG: YggS family pyridoxal phosphate-dependent enzyme [Chloroflexota bacterium]|nr:YggS family pyridoxal phosphate-dependent enzyme [Chloroflexota bacterium]MDE2942535.1 YggS family pyridoxal phosphate-dependent enzyme [Chloroflexota bacterium]MDE3267993.1 YggS family pyridoxal phosphate-dependent enzyme [Chloroflexota bacterium]
MGTKRDDIRERIRSLRERVARAAERAGRDPAAVTLLGACKTVDRDRVLQAVEFGVDHLGENFVQEAEAKFGGMERPAALPGLHLIGHLQSNKVRRAVALFDAIQSVDSVRLLSRIDAAAKELDRLVDVYVQVNLAGEATKEGVSPSEVGKLAEHAAACGSVRLAGLMAVPPHAQDPEDARPYFRMLREMRDEVCRLDACTGASLGLSMGMTADFEVAIEEGATLVRVGSAIWGARP